MSNYFQTDAQKKKLKTLCNLKNEYVNSLSLNLYEEVFLLKTEFNNLSTTKAVDMLIKSRHTFYEYGEKPTRLLFANSGSHLR